MALPVTPEPPDPNPYMCYIKRVFLLFYLNRYLFLGLWDAGLAPYNLKWPIEPNTKGPFLH